MKKWALTAYPKAKKDQTNDNDTEQDNNDDKDVNGSGNSGTLILNATCAP